MTILSCTLLVVVMTMSSSSPVPDNVGFMRTGGNEWQDSYGVQGQGRVRRQQVQGRPEQGQGRPGYQVKQEQGRPGSQRRPSRQQQRPKQRPQQKPQPKERYFKAQQNRPLQPVKQQAAPVRRVTKQEPVVLQAFEPEQFEVERDTQRVNSPVYNEVDRSYDTRPEPSTVYERSAVPDSLESESHAAPAEQRDLEAAVAAGAAAYNGESYAEPQRVSFQIHGQGGPNAYKYGYDTGVGYNRQFKYEERDNYGVLHGRYGYYDQEGKLQVVTYSSDPEGGFHAEGEHIPKPQY